ncbi:MAG: hypothetical protein K0R92_3481 [Lachnospiraceae bacterium]|jgi:hypothetical protein|nr:hypothetical protein [Lachnospiraceae bacterium]
MPIPVLTILIVILILWLQYEVRKGGKRSKQSNEAFWQNEKSSNLTNRKDITHLDFITISPDQLPMEDHEDQTINSYRDTILKLADKKIVNLTGFTNTELKFKYGAANINILAEYDNNYTVLVSILQKWAERLHTQGFTQDAISVLQFAITCYTDVTKSYKLLALIYKDSNTPDKINELIEIIPKTRMLDKDKLIEELVAIKIS